MQIEDDLNFESCNVGPVMPALELLGVRGVLGEQLQLGTISGSPKESHRDRRS